MGYTNYLTKKSDKKNAAKTEKLYKKTIKEIHEAILFIKKNTLISLSGYTPHTKVGQYGGINFNGKEDLAHEDFYLREHFNEHDDFSFCKTNQKPYDVAVKAAMLILKERMPDNWEISCDGNEEDWQDAKKIIKKFRVNKGIKKLLK